MRYKIMKTAGYLSFLLLLTMYGCAYTFHDRSGHQFKMYNLANDRSVNYLNNNTGEIKPFTVSNFSKNNADSIRFEYINTPNIQPLRKTVDDFIFIFWYPGCPGERNILETVNKLDTLKIPVAILSLSYDLTRIKDIINQSTTVKPVIYIIPSERLHPFKIVVKKLTFIRDACSECYKEYQGELVNAKALIFKKNEPSPKVLFHLNLEEFENYYAP